MRLKMKFLLFSYIFVSLASIGFSAPVIENLEINPQDLWLGESTIVTLNCSIENATIDDVYATIHGPDIFMPYIEFSGPVPMYSLVLDESYLDRTGNFNITVFCTSGNKTVDEFSTFTISELTGYINGIQPNPAYIGNVIEIYTIVEKDGIYLTSGVDFILYLGGQQKQLKINPIYDMNKGWVLKIDTPAIPGTYNTQVHATYDRANIIDSGTIIIKENIGFDITSIDKTWIKPDDEIYIVLNAQEMGSVIDVNKNNLKIEMGSVSAEIESITLSGNVFSIKLIAPHNSPGRYDLKASLAYKNSTLTTTEKIDYVVPVSGKFAGATNNVRLRFLLDGYEKLNLLTDSSGSYSGYIPVDKYDIHITFPKSKLILEGANVNEFDDPIRYSRLTGIVTPGIANHALYIYGVATQFDDARIEIYYNEREVDETDLKLFKCSEWNAAKNACNSKWIETDAEIDTIRNTVTLRVGSFSAFALGTEEKISLSLNLNKNTYNSKEPMELRGFVQDSRGEPISDVSLEAGIKNTEIKDTTTSDNNGVFNLGFIGPEEEGNYTIYMKAEKYPYVKYESETDINVKKSVSFSLVFPDSIKINPGENITQAIKLVNTGQSDIYDINITIIGIPEEYYTVDPFIGRLPAGEEKASYMYMSVPEYAERKTSAATIKAAGKDISREKTFGFTIETKKQEQETANQTDTITGFAIDLPELALPKIDEIFYMIIFALISFSAAFAIKRRNRVDRTEIKNTLSDIKNHMKKREEKIVPVVFPNIDDLKLDNGYKYG